MSFNTNRFTEKSIDAINASQNIAERNGNSQVEPEHLLLALLEQGDGVVPQVMGDRKSTRLNSSHLGISYSPSDCPYTTLFRSVRAIITTDCEWRKSICHLIPIVSPRSRSTRSMRRKISPNGTATARSSRNTCCWRCSSRAMAWCHKFWEIGRAHV